MFHAQCPYKRGVRLYDDVMLSAKGRDVEPSIEWMYLDLVDCRYNPGFRIQQFLQLNSGQP